MDTQKVKDTHIFKIIPLLNNLDAALDLMRKRQHIKPQPKLCPFEDCGERLKQIDLGDDDDDAVEVRWHCPDHGAVPSSPSTEDFQSFVSALSVPPPKFVLFVYVWGLGLARDYTASVCDISASTARCWDERLSKHFMPGHDFRRRMDKLDYISLRETAIEKMSKAEAVEDRGGRMPTDRWSDVGSEPAWSDDEGDDADAGAFSDDDEHQLYDDGDECGAGIPLVPCRYDNCRGGAGGSRLHVHGAFTKAPARGERDDIESTSDEDIPPPRVFSNKSNPVAAARPPPPTRSEPKFDAVEPKAEVEVSVILQPPKPETSSKVKLEETLENLVLCIPQPPHLTSTTTGGVVEVITLADTDDDDEGAGEGERRRKGSLTKKKPIEMKKTDAKRIHAKHESDDAARLGRRRSQDAKIGGALGGGKRQFILSPIASSTPRLGAGRMSPSSPSVPPKFKKGKRQIQVDEKPQRAASATSPTIRKQEEQSDHNQLPNPPPIAATAATTTTATAATAASTKLFCPACRYPFRSVSNAVRYCFRCSFDIGGYMEIVGGVGDDDDGTRSSEERGGEEREKKEKTETI